MNVAADAKRLSDEFVGDSVKVDNSTLVSNILKRPLPTSISTEQLNELLVRYMFETNQQAKMDTSPFVTFTPTMSANSVSSPSTSSAISQSPAIFGSLANEDVLKLMLMSQANQSPRVQVTDTITATHSNQAQRLTSVKPELQASSEDLECHQLHALCKPLLPKSTGPLTPQIMMEYLRNPSSYECVIQIFHARVAQKSYGNEKRFFCPPPSVYLHGGGWARKNESLRNILQRYKITPSANMYTELQKAELRVHIGIQALRDDQNATNGGELIVPWTNEPQELDFSNGKDYCAAKTLYISDSEKTKFFKLFVQTSFMSGQEIGTFLSERIKVISKPSKKKQQMKNNECSYLCITSGKKVALFHRLRSQTVSTRYLHVADQEFRASSSKWGAFTIHLVDEVKSPVDTHDFHTKDGYIYYGAVVKLVDTNSGISLPRLRIRKVGTSNIISSLSTIDEPVSQLHKCAFQFMDESTSYLSLVGDKIAQHRADITNTGQHQVTEGAAWTIISTEKVEYRFYEAMGPTWQPVSPVPVVDDITFDSDAIAINSYDNTLTLSLRGRSFNPDLSIWFAAHKCKTTYRSAEILDCDIPKIEELVKNPEILEVCEVQRDSVEVPIFLVREDGVVYSTCLTFTYMGGQELSVLRSLEG